MADAPDAVGSRCIDAAPPTLPDGALGRTDAAPVNAATAPAVGGVAPVGRPDGVSGLAPHGPAAPTGIAVRDGAA